MSLFLKANENEWGREERWFTSTETKFSPLATTIEYPLQAIRSANVYSESNRTQVNERQSIVAWQRKSILSQCNDNNTKLCGIDMYWKKTF